MVVGPSYQPQGILDWLYIPIGGMLQLLTKVDALSIMIKKGRKHTLQIIDKKLDTIVLSFPHPPRHPIGSWETTPLLLITHWLCSTDRQSLPQEQITSNQLLRCLPPCLSSQYRILWEPTAFIYGGNRSCPHHFSRKHWLCVTFPPYR